MIRIYLANNIHYNTVIHKVVLKICVNTSKNKYKKNFLVHPEAVRPGARTPTCPLATPLLFCPLSRFAPPSPTVHTSLLLSNDVCRRCNLACDRFFTLVVKFLLAPFWRPCTMAPGDICTPLPPLRYASAFRLGQRPKASIRNQILCHDEASLETIAY